MRLPHRRNRPFRPCDAQCLQPRNRKERTMLPSDPARRSRGGVSACLRIPLEVSTSIHISSRFAAGMRLLLTGMMVLATHSVLHAQTIEDGIMVSKNVVCTGTLYT